MLALAIKAKNSSGVQTLFIERAGGEISLCLTGVYEGREIQIDFEELGPEDVDDLILLLKHRRGLWCRNCRQEHEPCGQEDGGARR